MIEPDHPRLTIRRKMGLQAVHQQPKTTVPHPEHKKWPYLLRGLDIPRYRTVVSLPVCPNGIRAAGRFPSTGRSVRPRFGEASGFRSPRGPSRCSRPGHERCGHIDGWIGEGSDDLDSGTGGPSSRSKHRFARLFGDLEPDRIAGLTPNHSGSLPNSGSGADVIDLQPDQIASARLAVDGHVDRREDPPSPTARGSTRSRSDEGLNTARRASWPTGRRGARRRLVPRWRRDRAEAPASADTSSLRSGVQDAFCSPIDRAPSPMDIRSAQRPIRFHRPMNGCSNRPIPWIRRRPSTAAMQMHSPSASTTGR